MEIQTHPHCPYIYLDINAVKEKVNVNTTAHEEDVVDAMEYNKQQRNIRFYIETIKSVG